MSSRPAHAATPRRLRDWRPVARARYRLTRLIAGLIALAIAGHALVKVLASSDHHTSDWAYLGISCTVAAAVWLLLVRSAPRPPRRASTRAHGRGANATRPD